MHNIDDVRKEITELIASNYSKYFEVSKSSVYVKIVLTQLQYEALCQDSYVCGGINYSEDDFYIFKYSNYKNTDICYFNELTFDGKHLKESEKITNKFSIEALKEFLDKTVEILDDAEVAYEEETYTYSQLSKLVEEYIAKIPFVIYSRHIIKDDYIDCRYDLRKLQELNQPIAFTLDYLTITYRDFIDPYAYLYDTSSNCVKINRYSYDYANLDELKAIVVDFFENKIYENYDKLVNAIKERQRRLIIKKLENI